MNSFASVTIGELAAHMLLFGYSIAGSWPHRLSQTWPTSALLGVWPRRGPHDAQHDGAAEPTQPWKTQDGPDASDPVEPELCRLAFSIASYGPVVFIRCGSACREHVAPGCACTAPAAPAASGQPQHECCHTAKYGCQEHAQLVFGQPSLQAGGRHVAKHAAAGQGWWAGGQAAIGTQHESAGTPPYACLPA